MSYNNSLKLYFFYVFILNILYAWFLWIQLTLTEVLLYHLHSVLKKITILHFSVLEFLLGSILFCVSAEISFFFMYYKSISLYFIEKYLINYLKILVC